MADYLHKRLFMHKINYCAFMLNLETDCLHEVEQVEHCVTVLRDRLTEYLHVLYNTRSLSTQSRHERQHAWLSRIQCICSGFVSTLQERHV